MKKVLYIAVFSLLISGCGGEQEGNKTIPIKELPQIIKLVEESVENKNKTIALGAENTELKLQLLDLNSALKSAKADIGVLLANNKLEAEEKDENLFWQETQNSIDELGMIGFFTNKKTNTYALLRYTQEYFNAYKESHGIVRPTFPKIEGQLEQYRHNWDLRNQLTNFAVSFGQDPIKLLGLFRSYGSKINPLLPLEYKIEIKSNINHYLTLMKHTQEEDFKALINNLLNSEGLHERGAPEIIAAQQVLVKRYPEYTLDELQTASRHLTKNQDEWLLLAEEVRKTFEL